MTSSHGHHAGEGLTGDFSADSASGVSAMSGKTEILIPGTPNSYDLPKPLTTLAMQGCSIRDRFDRKATLAYNFSDEQSELAFNLNARGPTFDNPTRMEFRGAEIRFTYKMQKYKTPKERCLYASPFQGLIGSVYNEFSQRKHDTVIQELRAQGLDF
jgi:hypothetical protein